MRLLPRSYFKLIEQNILSSLPNLVLVRHTDSNKKQMGNLGKLHPDEIRIQSDHLRDLSCNLLGVFKIEDIFYCINNKEFHALWVENSDGLCPPKGQFFIDKNRAPYFIPIKNLLELEIPDVQGQKCHFMIFHTPTKCNFWHISIRLLNDKNQEISILDLSENKKRKIWIAARNLLIADIIMMDIVQFATIHKRYYTKSKVKT